MRTRLPRRLGACLLVAMLAVQVRAGAQIAGPPVYGTHGMVVSTSAAASEAGVEIMRRGGSAIDAAVAVGFALAVTYPAAGNIGGGGFVVARLADGREIALDFRETAPRAATPDRYVDAAGKAVPERSLAGPLAVAVPGSVAGLCLMQAKYGTLPLKDVMAPAIRLATAGFALPAGILRSLHGKEAKKLLAACPDATRIFLDGTAALAAGDLFKQPELAHTLTLIAERGPDVFYRGEIAALLVADLAKKGGVITAEDLAAYTVKERTPLVGSYRGRRIVTMPPSSSGGVALIEMLNVLEGWPLGKVGFGSERTTHLLAETMKRAFKDRADLLGDADFVTVPVRGLTSKEYAAQLRGTITETALVADAVKNSDPFAHEKKETTHFSVVDDRGNAVSCTTTLNGGYGAGIVVAGAGFFLNDEMDDFAVTPGVANKYGLKQSDRNKIEPGKRPLSCMTPTLVIEGDHVVFVTGSPGGPGIINTVLQTILNVVDHGMTASQAVAAPRIHHQWMPDVLTIEPFGLAPDIIGALERRGHTIKVRTNTNNPGTPEYQGDAHVILRVGGRWSGAADPRNEGRAVGY